MKSSVSLTRRQHIPTVCLSEIYENILYSVGLLHQKNSQRSAHFVNHQHPKKKSEKHLFAFPFRNQMRDSVWILSLKTD